MIRHSSPAEMLRHVAENAKKYLYNPRYLHTYVDEDVIGQWKRLCVGMPSNLGRNIISTAFK